MINYRELFEQIEKRALQDTNIYIVCGDGLDLAFFPDMVKDARNRIIACGISEQNQVSIANGLALKGKKVYCLMMTAFLIHRALDQVKMACFSNADINFIGYSTNIIPMEGGYSHISVDDFAILKNTPNLEIYNPYTKEELNEVIDITFHSKSPKFIAAVTESNDNYNEKAVKMDGFSKLINASNEFCLISSGDAINFLTLNGFLADLAKRIDFPTIYSAYRIQPFNKDILLKILKGYKYLVVFETRGEGALCSTIAEIIATHGLKIKGYRNHAVTKYLIFDNLPSKIAASFKCKRKKVFRKKYSLDYNDFCVTVKYRFMGFTYYQKVITKNKPLKGVQL